MAATYSATTFLLPSPYPTRFSRKLLVLRSSAVSPPLITRLRKQRKNYLRPKILKTRPDPLHTEPPYTIPEEILVDPQPDYPSTDPLIEEALKECDESLEVSVLDVNNNVGLGKFSKFTVFRIGLFLVGAYVFQTVCAVWLFGSGQNGVLDSEDESRVLVLNGDGIGKSRILMNGSGVVYVDEAEMKMKINEIQVMARDVREKERRELNNRNYEDLGGDDIGVDISRIEKEVIRRLGKSGKGVKKKPVGYKRKDDVGKNGLVSEDVKEVLLAKNAEFESSLSSCIDKAKGFRSLDDGNISKVENSSAILGNEALEKISDDNDGTELLDSVRMVEEPNGDLVRNDFVNSEEEEEEGSNTIEITRKKSSKGKERVKLGKAQPLNGKAVKLDESSRLNGSSSPRASFYQDTSSIGGHKASNGGVRNNKLVGQTDSWWLTLPYVLAVVMRTGGDGEEANELYTINSTSRDRDGSSHVVAFEDRGDATNFCYLLQSFFEYMDDFTTDIIPIPIKDLDEAVKSHTMKVIVVKKGQLQLYAGQPLSDVEMALRSLLEQS